MKLRLPSKERATGAALRISARMNSKTETTKNSWRETDPKPKSNTPPILVYSRDKMPSIETQPKITIREVQYLFCEEREYCG